MTMTKVKTSPRITTFSVMEFAAKIHKLGINPCVEVPNEIVNVLLREGNKKHAPVQVKATLNGKGLFETNVVRYSGAYRLYLNTQMRQETGVDDGDTVLIGLKYDPKQRMPPIPEELREALRKNKRAKERWRLQQSSRRKEILVYLNSVRSEDSINRQVSKIIRVFLE